MLAIALSFPTKRFHATPWGRQVNEGAVEWPPSPWRILRSLVAVWYQKFPDVPEAEIRELIDRIAALPRFYLPPASQGHTRHYMPLVNGDKTKIFDTFVAVDPNDRVLAIWADIVLSDGQREILRKLLAAMSYLGRAESWVVAELVETPLEQPNATAFELGVEPDTGFELVRTLVPTSPGDHAAWYETTRQEFRQRRLAELVAAGTAKGKSAEKIKLTLKDEELVNRGLPATLFDALLTDTADLRKAGWNQPPGSRWVNYTRPTAAFSHQIATIRHERIRQDVPTVARFALCGSVRPLLTEALFLGERIRKGLMCQSKRISGNAAPVFAGKTLEGDLLNDRHRHCHFLAEAPRSDARITHVNLFALQEFTQEEEQALRSFTILKDHRDGYDIQLVLLGIGNPEDFGGLNDKAGQSRGLAESRQWISRTPFVLTRHLKMKRSERTDPAMREEAYRRELIEVVRFELRQREQFAHLAETVEIEPILDPKLAGTDLGGHFTSWLKFRRERFGGDGQHASPSGYGFRLTFAEKVSGPLALGYGCHFGLGQFVPDE